MSALDIDNDERFRGLPGDPFWQYWQEFKAAHEDQMKRLEKLEQQAEDLYKLDEKMGKEIKQLSKDWDETLESAHELNAIMTGATTKCALVVAHLARNEIERGNPFDNGVESRCSSPAPTQTGRSSTHERGRILHGKHENGGQRQ